MLPVRLLRPEARLPTRGSPESAGLDIYCLESAVIPPHSSAKIKTGISVEIQRGYYGQLNTRSSMAVAGVVVVGGVIDSDYRGEISVVLFNHSDKPFHILGATDITAATRIAQLIILPCQLIEPILVEELSITKRGDGGFGSTGA